MARYEIKSDNPIANVLNGLKVLFGSRQVSSHSLSDLRQKLREQILDDYGTSPATLFRTDIGSRHGTAAFNSKNLLLFESSIIPVLQRNSDSNQYAARVLKELTSSTKDETKLFLGSIGLAYKIIEDFIWKTEGLALTYGKLKNEYRRTADSFEKIKGQTKTGIIERLLGETSATEDVEFNAFRVVYEQLVKSAPRGAMHEVEKQVYISISRANEKIQEEKEEFFSLARPDDEILAADNRISERSFSLVKSSELRNAGLTNFNLWTMSVSKLSGTRKWINKKTDEEKKNLLFLLLRSRTQDNHLVDHRNDDLATFNPHENEQDEEEEGKNGER